MNNRIQQLAIQQFQYSHDLYCFFFISRLLDIEWIEYFFLISLESCYWYAMLFYVTIL